MTTPEAALAAATLAMTVVKNEANDNYGTWTWTVEQGAERFLEVMRNEGYALTPLAPEVPPRRDGLRDAVADIVSRIEGFEERGNAAVHIGIVASWRGTLKEALRAAATRTPEPPDSRHVLFECWIHGNRVDPAVPPCADPHPMTERPTVAEMEAVREHRRTSAICGQVCPCGPNGEPLACAFAPGHEPKDHSWATLPTFPEPPDSGDGAASVALDDPAILPIQVRIHRARGDDWPVERCGSCFDLAYRYVKTSRLIRAAEPKDTGIEAALLGQAMRNTGQAENPDGTAWNPSTVRRVSEYLAAEYARLRSGSPAPEGGE